MKVRTGNLECTICHKSTRIANLSTFVVASCGGQQDQEAPVELGAQRASVQVAKRITWVQEHNQKAQQNGDLHVFHVPEQLDDDLMCSRCQATHTLKDGDGLVSWLSQCALPGSLCSFHYDMVSPVHDALLLSLRTRDQARRKCTTFSKPKICVKQ